MMLKILIFFCPFFYLIWVSHQEPLVTSANSITSHEQNKIMTRNPTYTELEEFIRSWFGLNKFDPVCSLPLEEKKQLCRTVLELPFFKYEGKRYSRTENEDENLNCESYGITVANNRYDRMLFICTISTSRSDFSWIMDFVEEDGIFIGHGNKKNSLAVFIPSGKTLMLYATVENIILRQKTPYPVVEF